MANHPQSNQRRPHPADGQYGDQPAPTDEEPQCHERRRAQQALGAHEAGLRRAQQMGKLAHVVTGPAGEFLAWSETLPAMLGLEPATMPTTTRAWLEWVHPQDRERFRQTAIASAKSGRRAQIEYRLRRRAGEWFHVREVMEPLDHEGHPPPYRHWLSTLQDITAATGVQRALRASGAHYRAAFEQAAVAIAHTSLDGNIRLANQAFCRLTGYTRAGVLTLHIRDLTHPEDIRQSLEGRARIIAGSGENYQRELRLIRKDGLCVWADVTTSLVRSTDGSALHFVTALVDISERKRAEEEAHRFRAAMDATLDAIFLSDPHTMRLLYVNDTACRRLGYSRERFLDTPTFVLLGKTRKELSAENDAVIAAGDRGTRAEARWIRNDGSEGWSELHRRAILTRSGPVIVTTARDITERKRQQQKIERLSRVHAMLSGINATIVRVHDRDRLFRQCCRIAHEAGGFHAVSIRLIDEQSMVAVPVAWHGCEESVAWLRQTRFSLRDANDATPSLLAEMLQTRRPAIINDALHDPRVPFRDMMPQIGVKSIAFLPLTTADKVVGVMSMYSAESGHFDDSEVKLLFELAADISFALEHLAKSERAAYLALYDQLTGLANRELLVERLRQNLQSATQTHSRLAVAMLDIERLRSVNKSIGRGAGDALLRQVAERLTQSVGAAATARLASDDFIVVLPGVRDPSEALRAISAVLQACFARPYVIQGTELRVGAKTGLAMFPDDGVECDALLVNAEAAMRKGKATGERVTFYTPDTSERTGSWLPLQSKLAQALEKDEFVLHYQPKIDASTRTIVGLEALIRWQSPDLGLVPPGKFIPLMEQTGMILDVGGWALQRAARDLCRWTEHGLRPLRVAVNVSAIQLRQADFVQAVQRAVPDVKALASIDLEITESLVMEDVEENIRKLDELRAVGVRIAIDDFGTGYSSLGYLAKLPAEALKIDRSFVLAMLNDPAAMTLVQTIISLAHALRLKVIAEGVETEEQAKYLRLLQCDHLQGYLFSKPVSFDEITRLLKAGQTIQV